MIGLRTFLKEFAQATDLVPFDTLYERQRELVRCGLLHSVPGRGPGAGVRFNPQNLATFLIGILASDKLAGLGPRTEALCKAVPIIRKKKSNDDYQVGKSNFHMGVTRALLQERKVGERSKADPYLGIQVTRPWRGIILEQRSSATQGQSNVEYFTEPEGIVETTLTMHNISIEGPVFSWLSHRMWDYLEHYYDLHPKPETTIAKIIEARSDDD